MDKTAWIVVIFCSLGLFWWFGEQTKIAEQAKYAQGQKAAQDAATAGQVEKPGPGPAVVEEAPKQAIEERTLSNTKADWVFTTGGGGIERVRLKEHNLKYRKKDSELPSGDQNPGRFQPPRWNDRPNPRQYGCPPGSGTGGSR